MKVCDNSTLCQRVLRCRIDGCRDACHDTHLTTDVCDNMQRYQPTKYEQLENIIDRHQAELNRRIEQGEPFDRRTTGMAIIHDAAAYLKSTHQDPHAQRADGIKAACLTHDDDCYIYRLPEETFFH